jgi:hypothetical protein
MLTTLGRDTDKRKEKTHTLVGVRMKQTLRIRNKDTQKLVMN